MGQPFYHLNLPFKGPSPAPSALSFPPGVSNGSEELPVEERDLGLYSMPHVQSLRPLCSGVIQGSWVWVSDAVRS